MAKLYNLARMTTATTGTGTIALGSAVVGYLTFALAGVANGETVSYGIKDGSNSEVGTGVYTSAGTTLTRSVTKSTNGDAAISLSGSAEVFITARKEDILNTADPLGSAQVATQSDQETATSTTLAVTPGRQHFHPGHPKAWARFGVTGNILASCNVTSVTDDGTGEATVNWDVDFSSANYAVVATVHSGAEYACIINPAAGSAGVRSRDAAGAAADPVSYYVIACGDQA